LTKPPVPPQDVAKTRNSREAEHLSNRDDRGPICKKSTAINPNIAVGQNSVYRKASASLVRDVVVMLMVRGDVEVAFRVALAGAEQVAPFGAPEQVIVAVPPKPLPLSRPN
jgi:hypothetical protein